MRPPSPRYTPIQVDQLIGFLGGGAIECITVAASHDAALLERLGQGYGHDAFTPLEMFFLATLDPFKACLEGDFNRPAGFRLRQALSAAIGPTWRWRPPRRTRAFDQVSGHAGRVRIPIARLWLAEDRHPAALATTARLRALWTGGGNAPDRIGLCNDRLHTLAVPPTETAPHPDTSGSALSHAIDRFMAAWRP
jgi:hypothetical protein